MHNVYTHAKCRIGLQHRYCSEFHTYTHEYNFYMQFKKKSKTLKTSNCYDIKIIFFLQKSASKCRIYIHFMVCKQLMIDTQQTRDTTLQLHLLKYQQSVTILTVRFKTFSIAWNNIRQKYQHSFSISLLTFLQETLIFKDIHEGKKKKNEELRTDRQIQTKIGRERDREGEQINVIA